MLIQITQKTEPLFSAIDSKMTKSESKAYAEKNPLFTWTGKYINQNRKKILCLVNNQTLAVVIINDVNATKKKKLAELIKAGISASFELCAIPYEQIQAYLEIDPTISYGPTSDRRVTGILNEMALMIESYGIDLSKEFPLSLILTLNNAVITTSQYPATDEASKAFNQPFQFTPLTALPVVDEKHKSTDTKKVVIEKNWQSYKEITKIKDEKLENEEALDKRLEANNAIVLDTFSDYLEKVKELGPKSVRKHRSRIETFIQTYLRYYGITTPIDSTDDFLIVEDFLSNFIVTKHIATSNADFSSYKTALKHFYTFLNYIGEISDDQLKEAKKAITIGGDDSFYELGNMDSFSWF